LKLNEKIVGKSNGRSK